MALTLRRRLVVALILVGCVGTGALADVTVYTDETAFEAALSSYYLEDFSGYIYGYLGPSVSEGPVNGFSYTLSADQDVFGGHGDVSTLYLSDPLVVTFTGDPVYAVGGNFYTNDIGANPLDGIGQIDLVLDYVTASATETLAAPTTDTFLGFISTERLSSLSVSAVAPVGTLCWPTVDNLYVGVPPTVVPVPGAFALASIGLGVAGWLSKRRNV